MSSLSPELVQLLVKGQVNNLASVALEASCIYTIGTLAEVARTRVDVVRAFLGDSRLATELAVAAYLRLAWQMAQVQSRSAAVTVTIGVPETSFTCQERSPSRKARRMAGGSSQSCKVHAIGEGVQAGEQLGQLNVGEAPCPNPPVRAEAIPGSHASCRTGCGDGVPVISDGIQFGFASWVRHVLPLQPLCGIVI